MQQVLSPILQLPKRKITRRLHQHVDRDHIRGWEIAGPLFEAGAKSISVSHMPRYEGGKHLPEEHRISLVVQGRMKFEVGSQTIIASAGDLVFTPAGITLQRTGLGPIVWLFIKIEDIPMWAPLKKAGPYIRRYESADLMYILARSIVDAHRSQDVFSIHAARESSQIMVTLMKRELRQVANTVPSKRTDSFVKLLDQIRARPDLCWDRGTIAEQLHISERSLIREFKRVFNMPPSKMVSNIRMDIASRLLISTDKTVACIADFVGYESPFSFSRLFKKCIGVSPEQYRTMPVAERQKTNLHIA